jgi:hypothetical protein
LTNRLEANKKSAPKETDSSNLDSDLAKW